MTNDSNILLSIMFSPILLLIPQMSAKGVCWKIHELWESRTMILARQIRDPICVTTFILHLYLYIRIRRMNQQRLKA